MRMLVERSLKIKAMIEQYGVVVIETHPLSALKSSGCRDYTQLFTAHGLILDREIGRDEADALVSALVAKYYATGNAFKVGARDGIVYLLPKICGHL